MVNVLKLEPLLFPHEYTSHRVRVLVDGVDVVATAYGASGFHGEPVTGFSPSHLLGTHGLEPSVSGREVALGGSDTTEDQLAMRVQQVGPAVTWDRWRIVVIGRVEKEGPEIELPTYRFDAKAYAAEITRAKAQADRAWPARSVAELLQAKLWRDGYDQDGGQWIRGYRAIRAPEDRPDVVEVTYFARDHSGLRHATPGTYVVTFPVRGTNADDQAQAIAQRLRDEDLKDISIHHPHQRRR